MQGEGALLFQTWQNIDIKLGLANLIPGWEISGIQLPCKEYISLSATVRKAELVAFKRNTSVKTYTQYSSNISKSYSCPPSLPAPL